MATRTLPISTPAPVEPSIDDSAVIHAEHLTKRFGDVLAVDDLSFALERGTVTGFLGPNGAGKTTTLRMLLHLVLPTAGRALVFGGRYQDLERPASRVGAHQTMAREWAYGLTYRSHRQRNQALPHWVDHYTTRRPHSSLGHRPPISRVHNVRG